MKTIFSLTACCLFTTSVVEGQLLAPVLPPQSQQQQQPSQPPQSQTLQKPALPEFAPQHVLEAADSGSLSLRLSETLLNEFVAAEIVDQGPVRDFILGADVHGIQQTSASTALDLVASQNAAMLFVNLQGTTRNQTTSFTPRAAIQSAGNYQFRFSKQVQFDGRLITTWTPSAVLYVDQRNLGAATRLTPIPLLGPLASQTALNVANQRNPAAERIAADKVTQQIGPRFNNDVDQQIGALNQLITKELPAALQQYQLDDLQFFASSTDTALTVTARLGVQRTDQQPRIDVLKSDVSLALDAALLNSLLGRLPLAGLRLPDTALTSLLESGNLNDLPSAIPKLVTVILDDQQPLRFAFQNGGIEIEARLAAQPVLGEPLPTHRFVVRMEPELTGNELRLTPSVVEIEQLDQSNGHSPISQSKELIESFLVSEFENRPLPRSFAVPAMSGFQPTTIFLTGLRVERGQLHVDLDVSPVCRIK